MQKGKTLSQLKVTAKREVSAKRKEERLLTRVKVSSKEEAYAKRENSKSV